MYRKITVFLTIVALTTLLAGCGAKETDDVAYVIGLGIDKTEQGKVKVTYRIMVPRAVGGTQGAGQEVRGGPNTATSYIAPNTAEAFNLLSTGTSRHINLTHLKGIIIGEALAREGVSDIITVMRRYREYRGSMFINVAKGRAEDFMLNNNPKLDYVLSKFWESFMETSESSSYYRKAELHDFFVDLKSLGGGSPYANYITINPLTGEDKPAGKRLPGERVDAYLPGNIPRTGAENPTEFAGLAIFSGDKMVGTLDTTETRIFAILKNNLSRGLLVMDDPLEPKKAININLRNGSKPKIEVDMVDGREVIRIDVFLEGDLTGIPSGINYEKGDKRELLEAEISDLVKRQIQEFLRHTQALGCDVFGFGYHLRNKFSSYDEMKKVNFVELYRSAESQVQVTTKIRRTGVMWRTSPNQPQVTSP